MSKPTRAICYGGGPFDGAIFFLATVPTCLGVWTPWRRCVYRLTGFKPSHAVLVYDGCDTLGPPPGGVSVDAVAYWESHADVGTTGTAMIGMGTVES